jgi:hypothetical protein
VLFPHEKYIETLWKMLHHMYCMEVKFVGYFKGTSLICL